MLNITLAPGEVCIFDVRAECGVPSFSAEGLNSEYLKISTIDFDDTDIKGYDESHSKKMSALLSRLSSEVIAHSNDLGQDYLSDVQSWKFTSGVLANGTKYQTVQYS